MEKLFLKRTTLCRIKFYPPKILPHSRDELYMKTKSAILWMLAIIMELVDTIL
jgi:hypothetical protein